MITLQTNLESALEDVTKIILDKGKKITLQNEQIVELQGITIDLNDSPYLILDYDKLELSLLLLKQIQLLCGKKYDTLFIPLKERINFVYPQLLKGIQKLESIENRDSIIHITSKENNITPSLNLFQIAKRGEELYIYYSHRSSELSEYFELDICRFAYLSKILQLHYNCKKVYQKHIINFLHCNLNKLKKNNPRKLIKHPPLDGNIPNQIKLINSALSKSNNYSNNYYQFVIDRINEFDSIFKID